MVPKFLNGVLTEIVFTCCVGVVLSVLSTMLMYQDMSCATMTGAPFQENVVAMIWKKLLSKFNVPSVAFKIVFHNCASWWICLMTSSIDSCFSPVLDILLALTNPSIPIIVSNSPSRSL